MYLLLTHCLSTHVCVCVALSLCEGGAFITFPLSLNYQIYAKHCRRLSPRGSLQHQEQQGTHSWRSWCLYSTFTAKIRTQDSLRTTRSSHSDYFYLSLSLSLQFWISSSPQPAKANERPLESGSALGFFRQGSFSMLLSHLAWPGGFNCFFLDCGKCVVAPLVAI